MKFVHSLPVSSNKLNTWIYISNCMELNWRYFILGYKFNDSNIYSRNSFNHLSCDDQIHLFWHFLYWTLVKLILGDYWYVRWLIIKRYFSECSILRKWLRFQIVLKECRLLSALPFTVHFILAILYLAQCSI